MRFCIPTIAACCVILSCGPEFWQGFNRGLNNYSAQRSGSKTEEGVCVKYETEHGWSKGYEVIADIVSGSVLNRATTSFNYKSYATYAVVWWDDGECSILELQNYFGSIPVYDLSATDQYGRKWKISTSSVCF